MQLVRRRARHAAGRVVRRRGAHRARRRGELRIRQRVERRSGRGSVTAEVAMVLPVIVVMLLAATWSVGLVVTHIRCLDAARDVARAVARGEPADEARRIGERAAPGGSTVEVTRTGDDVTAVVRTSVDWPLLGGIGDVQVEERATVQAEPSDETGGDES